MKVTDKEYDKMVKAASKPSPKIKNAVMAFVIGGGICTLGQALKHLWSLTGLETPEARAAVACTLVFFSALFTALGWYSKIAKHAGAGTLVPITGFANAVAAPALEFKSEGFVLGTGAKMFVMAGSVLVYGTTASIIYGIIIWIFQK